MTDWITAGSSYQKNVQYSNLYTKDTTNIKWYEKDKNVAVPTNLFSNNSFNNDSTNGYGTNLSEILNSADALVAQSKLTEQEMILRNRAQALVIQNNLAASTAQAQADNDWSAMMNTMMSFYQMQSML